MTIKEILKTIKHRPWKLPNDKWKFYQEWNNTVFLHWEVDYDELRKFVPEEIEIDLYDGKPWVSLVAFTMEKVRPKYLPPFPPISNFDEINIRTYVKHNNKGGVYFISIEGGTKLSCFLAKSLSGLPYRYSKMNRDQGQYHSINAEYKDRFELDYEIKSKINAKTEIDKWLTERYALFQDSKNGIDEFDIHHVEWSIDQINLKGLKVDYPRFNKLLSNSPNLVHYSSGVQALAWDKNISRNRDE